MSMLLVHELHEARDRIHLLIKLLEKSKESENEKYKQVIDEKIASLYSALELAKIPDHYKVAVVGRFKVGKSAFVNNLAGERLAGVDTNPETAAISIFRYGEKSKAEIEFIDQESWEKLKSDHEEDPKNNEVKRFDKFINFNSRPGKKTKEGKEEPPEQYNLQSLVSKWVVPGGYVHTIKAESWETAEGKKKFLQEIKNFTTGSKPHHYLVNKLTIYAPIPILKDQIELIDTPGLDDTEHFRVLLTEDLVKDVDAILFLTISGASYSQSDKEFIIRQLRRKQIKHLQLIVTKCDETFENAVRDAEDNDDDPPSYSDFRLKETNRIKGEVKATLAELLEANQVNDDDGYYYIDQLDNVPIHLVSSQYHKNGERERGGIDSVRDSLYQILSTSHRFEKSKSILSERIEQSLFDLKRLYSDRFRTLESEFDPQKVKDQIELIKIALDQRLDSFSERSIAEIDGLKRHQDATFKAIDLHLENIGLLAREALVELEAHDLIKHWKTRRHGYWGTLHGVQNRVADKIFPRVETILNELRTQLDNFMGSEFEFLKELQTYLERVEQDHELPGMEKLALADAQQPLFEEMRRKFQEIGSNERDVIIAKIDDFVTDEVEERLNKARNAVAGICGVGTTIGQSVEVRKFYNEVKQILSEALSKHLRKRFQGYSELAIKNAESVWPTMQRQSRSILSQRLQSIEATLEIQSEEQKNQLREYLSTMTKMLNDFAASPEALTMISNFATSSSDTDSKKYQQLEANESTVTHEDIKELHYEILDGDTGYTYERIFRPYIDGANRILIEDPYIRSTHQVENFVRFCALATRFGNTSYIELISGYREDDDTRSADDRLNKLQVELESRNIEFRWSRTPVIHDREIRIDDSWVIKIGRGLDIYHKPESWQSMEATDFSLRKCRQTKIDIYKI